MERAENGEEVAQDIYATVQTSEEFVASANKDPEIWTEGLQRLAHSFRMMREDYRNLLEKNVEVQRENDEMRAKTAAQKKRLTDTSLSLQEVKQNLQDEQETLARVRRLRERWRQDAEELAKENEDLKQKLLHQDTPVVPQGEVDSDDDRPGATRHLGVTAGAPSVQHSVRHQSVAPSHTVRQQSTAPSNTIPNTIQTNQTSEAGGNKRYPDVPVFHGTHDRDT